MQNVAQQTISMLAKMLSATIHSESITSACGKYRYVLKRKWCHEKPIGAFLCANPSKATELLLDDTVFHCNNLAVYWNWGGFYILNLWPNYSTDSAQVATSAESDKQNAEHIARVFAEIHMLVLASGGGKKRQERLAELINGFDRGKLFCLEKNKDGSFLHPARIKPENFPKPVKAD